MKRAFSSVPYVMVAPMQRQSTPFFRQMMRLITKHTPLWTEMVVDQKVVHNFEAATRMLPLSQEEDPLVLQLGGNNPHIIEAAARRCLQHYPHYREINLNCGCPSNRVAGQNEFGAALMRKPQLVGELTRALARTSGGNVPVSVKHRLGLDLDQSYEKLTQFVRQVHEEGEVSHFIVHARNAVLGSAWAPRQNLKVPPIRYDVVHQLQADFPELQFTVNGEVSSYEETAAFLKAGLNVMIGRSAISNPWLFSNFDAALFGADANPAKSREAVAVAYIRWLEGVRSKAAKTITMAPLQHLFEGCPGVKAYRSALVQGSRNRKLSPSETLVRAMRHIPERARRAPPREPSVSGRKQRLADAIGGEKTSTQAVQL